MSLRPTRCALALSLMLVALVPAPAHALTTSPVVVVSAAWYSATQSTSLIYAPPSPPPAGPLPTGTLPSLPEPPPAPAAPPANPAATAGVPEGAIAVAAVPAGVNTDNSPHATPEKISILSFGIDALAPGSTITEFEFTLRPDPEGRSTTGATPPKLIACLPEDPGLPDTRGAGFDVKPEEDCSSAVAATPGPDGSYTFRAPAYAQFWLDELNAGVSIRNAPDSSPFQLVFDPALTQARISYEPPSSTTLPEPPAPDQDPQLGSDLAPTEELALPGVALGPLSPESTTPTSQKGTSLPRTGSAPQVVGKVGFTEFLRPDLVFFLACAAMVLLLGALSLILGDPHPGTRKDARSRALAQHGLNPRPSRLERSLVRASRTA